MVRVIILIEPVEIGVVLSEEREKGDRQNVTVFGGIHNTSEHH